MSIRTPTYLVGTPNGDVQRQTVTITSVTASGGGNGIKLTNYRFDKGGEPINLYGTLSDNAHINVYVYPYPGDTSTRHLETVLSAGISSFTTATGTFAEVLNGSFWGIEGEKVAVSGAATMIGYL